MKKPKKDSKRAKGVKGAELVGYARVSTAGQNLGAQLQMLRDEGCDRIFVDQLSGAKVTREGWHDCWRYLREGDTLLFWDLTRIGRNAEELIRLEREFYQRGIKMRSFTEPSLDTTTAHGRLMYNTKAVWADYERRVTQERTKSNIAFRRAQGAKIGRPSAVTDEMRAKINIDLKAKNKYGQPKYMVREIWERYGLSKQQFMYAFPGGRQGRKT